MNRRAFFVKGRIGLFFSSSHPFDVYRGLSKEDEIYITYIMLQE